MTAMPALVVETPLSFPLSFEYLTRIGAYPLVVGTDLNFRFQFRDSANAAVNLTGALIEMTLMRGGVTVVRSTANTIVGSPGVFEIAIDAGQGSEVGDTGKGWYQCNFTSYSGDIVNLTPLKDATLPVTVCDYRIKVNRGPGLVEMHFIGTVDLL